MLAMTYRGPSKVRITEKPDARLEHPNDVVLRVTRAAICGSDLHLYHGFIPDTRVGHTFGHEFTGVVVEVGSSVESLGRGDRVVVPFNISCGTCFMCQRGLFGNCEDTNPCSNAGCGIYGYSHTTGGYDGGQAELVRVPFADVGPMKIPADMSEEDVLLLSDVVPTGYQAAEMGEIKVGETVVVFGCGPVGLMAAKSAWLMGAGRVIAVDQFEYRLEFMRRFAGQPTELVNFTEVDDVVTHLRKLTEGRGPDVCIDAVGLEADGSTAHTLIGRKLMLQAGAPTAISWAIETVRKGGNVVLMGVYGPPWNIIPIGTAMNKGLTLRMNQANVKRYLPRMLEHVRAGRIDAKALITHRFPLEAVADAYDLFARRQDGCIKCVLIPEA
jgi:threonine dehydrogenase-like Zn-dependent dehydrogenase